jgi:hypothetical protein
VFHVEHSTTDPRYAASQFLHQAAEEAEERRRAGLVENDLEPVSVRRSAGFASLRADERVLESCGCGAVVGFGLMSLRRRLCPPLDLGLELADGPASFCRQPAELAGAGGGPIPSLGPCRVPCSARQHRLARRLRPGGRARPLRVRALRSASRWLSRGRACRRAAAPSRRGSRREPRRSMLFTNMASRWSANSAAARGVPSEATGLPVRHSRQARSSRQSR